jgi:protein-disulfide isomerase-like protein with CxxC motif
VKPKIIYCYDAYCGWCYGFSPVIQQIWQTHKDQFDFETLSVFLEKKALLFGKEGQSFSVRSFRF